MFAVADIRLNEIARNSAGQRPRTHLFSEPVVAANSGLSVVNYSANDQAALGKGNMIISSDTEGLYLGVSGSIGDFTWDPEKNNGYYGQQVSAAEIISGNVSSPAAQTLRQELAQK